MEAVSLGFNFDQVKCQLFFFFFIRKAFNRFSPVDLRSQEEMQGKKIRPTLSFGFAETGYIHPINSWPRATLRLLKTNQKLRSQCSGKPLLTKCHEVYKRTMLPFSGQWPPNAFSSLPTGTRSRAGCVCAMSGRFRTEQRALSL